MEIEDSILEDEYYSHSLYINADIEGTKELMSKVIELQEKLFLKLAEEQKQIYLEIEEVENHKISLIRKNVFKYAFKLGIEYSNESK